MTTQKHRQNLIKKLYGMYDDFLAIGIREGKAGNKKFKVYDHSKSSWRPFDGYRVDYTMDECIYDGPRYRTKHIIVDQAYSGGFKCGEYTYVDLQLSTDALEEFVNEVKKVIKTYKK